MDKTYARFVVTISASVDDINALSDSVENLTQALVDDIDDKCTAYTGSTIRVKFNELKEYDWNQSAEQSVQRMGCTCRKNFEGAVIAIDPNCPLVVAAHR